MQPLGGGGMEAHGASALPGYKVIYTGNYSIWQIRSDKGFFFFLQTQFIIYVIGLGRQMAQNCTVKAWIPFQNRLISAGGTLHIAYGSGREDLFGGPGCSESSCVQ